MYTRAASAIALVVCLVLAPMGLAAAQGESKAHGEVKKQEVKKDLRVRGATGEWKSGTAPVVRPIPYQPPTSRPSAVARTASTRPADTFRFTERAPRYDYFADHYGVSTGSARTSSDVVGYVAPEKKSSSPAAGSNAGNPFIYRRGQ